ncbi:hypothetical protein NDU88_007290 [Pleurodeles waltl]|uniref:Uncharacterized protein n=1 Tax=Pleurodeles waltl TaxID=8319 RepID=A0AAV7SRZ5_PLEWA|nr:hypothetical protein NDU88_007290 [Pleurodeles waltl]
MVVVLPRRWRFEPGPPGCPDLRVSQAGPGRAGGLRRGADPGQRTGRGSGPLEVNPGACGDRPRGTSAAVKSGAAAPGGAPEVGLGLGPRCVPDLLLGARGGAPCPPEVASGCILVI